MKVTQQGSSGEVLQVLCMCKCVKEEYTNKGNCLAGTDRVKELHKCVDILKSRMMSVISRSLFILLRGHASYYVLVQDLILRDQTLSC